MNDELPLLTYDFLDYFSKQDLGDKVLVEIGSGISTLYWEKRFKKVISYENDLFYFDGIRKKLKKKTTEIHLYDKNIFRDQKFFKNIAAADYILIDNDPHFISRFRFSVHAAKSKKESSSIILDNGTWNIKAYRYLMTNFFVKDFPGFNTARELTVTSVFSVFKGPDYY